MNDLTRNRQLNSTLNTTNTLLSSSKLNLSSSLLSSKPLILSSNTQPTLIGSPLLKKKSDDTSSLLDEIKKPKLSLGELKLTTLTSTTSKLSISQTAFTKPLVTSKPVLTSHVTTTLHTSLNSSISAKAPEIEPQNTKINALRDTYQESFAPNTITDMNDLFKDLTKSKEYLRLIDLINEEHMQFDEETKVLEEKNTKFSDAFASDMPLKANTEAVRLKNVLINIVSSSLLRQPNFKDPNDATRADILKIAERLVELDAEFILKLALYSRKELNIRVTSNFLLTLAAYKSECRKYLPKYFNDSVMLPSDWIDVAEQYQVFFDPRIKFGSLPSALRKCMVAKFPDFDAYQLGKYNKEKKPKDPKKASLLKHIRGQIKPGNETVAFTDDANVFEERYFRRIKDGLCEGDSISVAVQPKERCNYIKIDLLMQENTEEDTEKKPKQRRAKPKADAEKQDLVPLRVLVNYEHTKISTKYKIHSAKQLEWKTFEKRGLGFQLDKSTELRVEIHLDNFQASISINGTLFAKNSLLTTHSKINCVRVSGVECQLKSIDITTSMPQEDTESVSEDELEQKTFTLKQLIRQLHIAKPVRPVLCLLGKKYPGDYDEFMASGLDGTYDSEQANKRMRLPIPETWETQVSMKGNKAAVWQDLIDHKKLPYMAMLRNLRNMIKAGMSPKHHDWVIKKLQDEGAVVNSKQFPFRFFSAYEVIDELEKELNGEVDAAPRPSFRRAVSLNPRKKKAEKTEVLYNESLLKRYKTAVDNALKVATTFNISPIRGRSLILVDISANMNSNCKTARLGKSARSVSDIAILLGLMFKYSCEHSRLMLFSGMSSTLIEMQLEPGTILDNMKTVSELRKVNLNGKLTSPGHQSMSGLLNEAVSGRVHYDNLVVLSQDLVETDDFVQVFTDFLKKYRLCVNRDLLFVNVDLGAREVSLERDNIVFDHQNDVLINGYSDSILRFVAEKGNSGQLLHVDNIDKSYDLPKIDGDSHSLSETIVERPLKIATVVPRWTTVKVFVSSTFRDMHAERDILSRVVFPMLRSKLSARFINVYEVDLRWGITESEAMHDQALNMCLSQVLDAEFFVGLLGERYGSVLGEYNVEKRPEFEWVGQYPGGASVTEMEIQCGAFERSRANKDNALAKTFFYFRDGRFLDVVPEKLRGHFVEENGEFSRRLDALKKRIRGGGFEVFDGYECLWLGMDADGRALVTGLEKFAQRVFDNLLNAICEAHPFVDAGEVDEHVHVTETHLMFARKLAETFYGRGNQMSECERLVKNQMVFYNFKKSVAHVLVVNGEPGCGKSALLAKLSQELSQHADASFVHFVGAMQGSEYIAAFLQRFCIQISRMYNLDIDEEAVRDTTDLKYLRKTFENALNKAAVCIDKKFFVFVDSVDLFVDDNRNIDESFSWLPEAVPEKFSFIFSARSTSDVCKNLKQRYEGSKKEKEGAKAHVDVMELSSLEILEKSEIVRKRLGVFNKKLDESGFNNQMKLVTAKKDSTNPLYLSLVCEELRLHGNFDTLGKKLKEIPQKYSALIAYVLNRLDADFGANYVGAALMFLSCSQNGLLEFELKKLLNLHMLLEHEALVPLIENCDSLVKIRERLPLERLNMASRSFSEAKFTSFMQSISVVFLQASVRDVSAALQIKCGDEIKKAIQLKYSKVANIAEKTHKSMALFYWLEIDPQLTCEWTHKNPRAFTSLPFHLTKSLLYQDLTLILSDLKFVSTKCLLGLTRSLMDDYDLHSSTASNLLFNPKKNLSAKTLAKSTISDPKFIDFKTFLTSNYHILLINPSLVFQQALNQPESSAPYIDLHLMMDRAKGRGIGYMFELLTKPADPLVKNITASSIMMRDFNEGVTCLAISPNNQYVACGTEDAEIKLFALSNAAFLKRFQGHAGRITSLCFIGTSTLCSTSADGLASLWNVVSGYRIKTLNKHNGHVVSACISEPNGKSLLTTGWDCTIKIWDPLNGDFQAEIRGHGKPINCVAFDPNGDCFATGCWDSCVRIFNLFHRERKAVFRGHVTSVRSVAYSRNGVYVASAALDGEVILWNAKTGSQCGVMRGHALPVNCLRYSPSSDALVTASTDGKTKVWSSNMGRMVRVVESDCALTCVAFSGKSGKYLAVGYQSGEIRVFSTISFNLAFKFNMHGGYVRKVRFSADERYLVSTGEDGSCAVSGFTERRCVMMSAASQPISALDVNCNDVIVTGGEDALLRIYPNVIGDFNEIGASKKIEPSAVLSQHSSPVTAVSFNTLGNKFASTSKDATLVVWKYAYANNAAEVLFEISAAHSDWITDCRWSNSAEFVLTASNDFTLKVWDVEARKVKSTMVGHAANINACAFQYGCAVSVGFDAGVKVWSHRGHEITTLVGHQARVNGCDMFVKLKSKRVEEEMEVDGREEASWGDLVDDLEKNEWKERNMKQAVDKQSHRLDELLVATVSDDRTLRLWKPMETSCLMSLEGHNGRVESVALSADGVLATASNDASVRLWNMSEMFKSLGAGKMFAKGASVSHKAEVSRMVASTRGGLLVTASRDGMVLFWRFEKGFLRLLLEVEAHTKCCNWVCVVKEERNCVEVATCGDDFAVKLWSVENFDDDEAFKVELKQKEIFSGRVMFVEKFVDEKRNEYLVCVADSVGCLEVRLLRIRGGRLGLLKSVRPNTEAENAFVSHVGLSGELLTICLVDGDVLYYRLSAVVGESDGVEAEKLDIFDEDESMDYVWFTAHYNEGLQDEYDFGDSKGVGYSVDGEKKKIHEDAVTKILKYRRNGDVRTITASLDGTVRIWADGFKRKLGQFSFNSAVCDLVNFGFEEKSNTVNLACADKMGGIHVLKWYDR